MGVGGERDHLVTQIPKIHRISKKHHNKTVRTKIVHTSRTFFKTKKLKRCSYIQKKTPNPINAFKIKVYNTKHTNNTDIHFPKKQKVRKQIELFKKENNEMNELKMISVVC